MKVLFQNVMKSSEIEKESFPVFNNSIGSVKCTEINNSSPWRVFENKNKFSEPEESSLYPHTLYSQQSVMTFLYFMPTHSKYSFSFLVPYRIVPPFSLPMPTALETKPGVFYIKPVLYLLKSTVCAFCPVPSVCQPTFLPSFLPPFFIHSFLHSFFHSFPLPSFFQSSQWWTGDLLQVTVF